MALIYYTILTIIIPIGIYLCTKIATNIIFDAPIPGMTALKTWWDHCMLIFSQTNTLSIWFFSWFANKAKENTSYLYTVMSDKLYEKFKQIVAPPEDDWVHKIIQLINIDEPINQYIFIYGNYNIY